MAEILGAELQADRFISADPTNGVLAAIDTAGAAVNLVAYSPLTGDVTYSAPTGTGTNTRRHLFDRPIAASIDLDVPLIRRSTSDGADNARLTLTGAGAASVGRGAVIELFGNEHTGTGRVDIIAGDVTGGDIVFYTGLVLDRARISRGGAFLVGTTVTTDAAAGDIVLANAKGLRGVIAAGIGTRELIGLNASNEISIALGGQDIRLGTGVLAVGNPVTLTSAAAGDVVLANTKAVRAVNAAGTDTFTMIRSDNGNRVIIGSSITQVGIGAPVTMSSAVAGEVVLANDRGIRGVNAAGTDTKGLIYLSSTDKVVLGGNTQDVTFGAAKKFYVDGGGDTYITEGVANQIYFYAGAVLTLQVNSTDIAMRATGKFYLDGGGDSYIAEGAADRIDIVTAGVTCAMFKQGCMALVDGIAAPTAQAGLAYVYVDTADGDLKVRFGDGTIKTIVVDT